MKSRPDTGKSHTVHSLSIRICEYEGHKNKSFILGLYEGIISVMLIKSTFQADHPRSSGRGPVRIFEKVASSQLGRITQKDSWKNRGKRFEMLAYFSPVEKVCTRAHNWSWYWRHGQVQAAPIAIIFQSHSVV